MKPKFTISIINMMACVFVFIHFACNTDVKEKENIIFKNKKRNVILSKLPQTDIHFDNLNHGFGDIKNGDIVTHEYHFRNTGDNPLIIGSVMSSCGCTITDYPKEPILPGESRDIQVSFNSANRTGKNHREIRVYSNSISGTQVLSFTANVID